MIEVVLQRRSPKSRPYSALIACTGSTRMAFIAGATVAARARAIRPAPTANSRNTLPASTPNTTVWTIPDVAVATAAPIKG